MYRNKLKLRCRSRGIGWLLVAFSFAIAMNGCGVFGVVAVRHDLSDFEVFSFALEEGLGFCPSEGAIAEATISRLEDGSYSLQIGIVTAVVFEQVEIGQEIDRLLTDEEAAHVQSVFRNVFVHPLREGFCYFPISFDPCVTQRFDWDSLEVSSYTCAQPRLSARSAAEIVSLLEALREG